MTSARKSKFGILTPFSLLSTNMKFLSKQTPFLGVLDWSSKPWVILEFSWKTISMRSTFSRIVFFWLMHIVFAILICIIKLTEKPWVFHQPYVPLVLPLKNYKWSLKEVSGWNQCNIETESVIEHSIWWKKEICC